MSDDERVIQGIGVTPLSGIGTVRWYDPTEGLSLPDKHEAVDSATEWERFDEARETARHELQSESERTKDAIGEEEAEILDAHMQFLDDPLIVEGVREAIDSERLPAENAVDQAFADGIEQLEESGGMMAERADDLRDVRDRILRILLGRTKVDLSELPAGTVVLAERLTPSDTAQIDPDHIAGFGTILGGRTSHAAIMARALGLPAVVGAGEGLRAVEDGHRVVIDGEAGAIVAGPSTERLERARREREVTIRQEPVTTADGREIEVAANIGNVEGGAAAAQQGADAVGLFRTEFLFLDRESPPNIEEQFDAYVDVLDVFEGSRVVIRTLDVGGDKPVPYLDVEPEANPFLGVRGIRLVPGERPDLFDTQLRALLRAAGTPHGDQLAVMFPMVATVEELDDALNHVDRVAQELEEAGFEYGVPELGVMIETPASTFMARELGDRLDFLSIGTNDLTQYIMAAARDDERVADLNDPLHPAVLRAIDRIVDAGHRGDAWVGMCGEMAGNPALTELLVGLGLDELSLSAVTIPRVKEEVLSIQDGVAEDVARDALAAETRAEVQEILGLE